MAQGWTGVAPSTGDYYIQNVESGMLLNHGSSWGTHVTVDGAGCVITVGGSAGAYTLHHAGIAANKYQTEDGWSDNTTAGKFTFEDAGDGAYYIKCSNGNYYKWSGVSGKYCDEAAVAEKEETNAFKWILVPKATREAFVAGNDVTYKIGNPDFHANINGQNAAVTLTPWTTDFGTNESQQLNFTGAFAEKWTAAPGTLADLSHKQTITGLPAGKYTLSVAGNSVQQSDGSAGTGTFVYAGTAQTEFTGQGIFSVNFASTGGDVEIGIKTVSTSANWVSFDKFRLTFVGSILLGDAVALPVNGDMDADTWYYVDIAASGDYNFTATTAANIVYTTDGEQLTSSATGSAIPAETTELIAGRIYVKSSTANNLVVAPNAFVYEVGAPTLSTADGKYTQSNTFTVTFPSAASNDPEATTALVDGAQATVNGSPVALTSVSGGISVSLGEIVAGQDYVITIPADVYGYEGESMNSAINATIHTPEVLDGTYYVKASNGKYLSRGNNYNTRAVIDNYGIAVNVATNAENITTFQFVDNKLNLFDANNGTVYTDNATKPKDWQIVAVAGGYNIINKNNNGNLNQPLVIKNGDSGQPFQHIACANETGEVFTFEVPAAHPAVMAALKDAQAASVASAAGISASNVSELNNYVEANYNLENVSFTAIPAGEAFQAGKDVNTTINDLENGLYKVSVQAYYRVAGHADTWNLRNSGLENPTAYLYANDEQMQLLSLFDQVNPSTTSRHTNDQKYGNYYYPDRTAGGDAAFNAGNYWNEVYVNVTDGTLKIGILLSNKCTNGGWLYYSNFKVEKLTQASATMAVNAEAKYGTFCAPFAVTVPAGVTASTAELNANGYTIDLTTVGETIPANTPVILYAEEGLAATTVYGKAVAGTTTAGVLTGVYASTPAQDGWYVLQNNDSKVGFYQVDTEVATPIVGANRCYLTAPAQANVRAFFFDGEANGIANVNAVKAENNVMYNIAGQRVNANAKGIVIINGKKYNNK